MEKVYCNAVIERVGTGTEILTYVVWVGGPRIGYGISFGNELAATHLRDALNSKLRSPIPLAAFASVLDGQTAKCKVQNTPFLFKNGCIYAENRDVENRQFWALFADEDRVSLIMSNGPDSQYEILVIDSLVQAWATSLTQEPLHYPLPQGFYLCHWKSFRIYGTESVIRDAVLGQVLVERNWNRRTEYKVSSRRYGEYMWKTRTHEPQPDQESARDFADACAQSLGGWKEDVNG